MIDLVVRATHEQELFPPARLGIYPVDRRYAPRTRNDGADTLVLSDAELLQWLARWGHTNRLELADNGQPLHFQGRGRWHSRRISKTATRNFPSRTASRLPGWRKIIPLAMCKIFQSRQPPLALGGQHVLSCCATRRRRRVLRHLVNQPSVPVRKLSHRLLLHLRKTQSNHGVDWEQPLHRASPQHRSLFLNCSTRPSACGCSQKVCATKVTWFWNGHEWVPNDRKIRPGDKPEILDDPRLEPGDAMVAPARLVHAPESGLWIGDANENFLDSLAGAWNDASAAKRNFLATRAFHRLFLTPRLLKPKPNCQRQRH